MTDQTNIGDGTNIIVNGNATFSSNNGKKIVSCRNISPMSGGVARKDLTSKLFQLLNDDNIYYVNLWGIGGVGKSSLVRLCIFSEDYKERFGSVVYIPVENNIESDFVKEIRSKEVFKGLKSVEVNTQNDVSTDFEKMMKDLGDNKTISGKINLFIFDINDSPHDDKGKTVLERKIDGNGFILPAEWKILLITHRKCNNIKDVPVDDDDVVFINDLFEEKCRLKINDVKLKKDIFRRLFYNPLLVSVAAAKIFSISDIDKIFKIAKDETVSLSGHEKAMKVSEYLKDLVRFENLTYNQQILVIMFMLWPTKFIPYNVVCSFLRGYSFRCRNKWPYNSKEVFHKTDYFKYAYGVENKKVNDIFDNELKTLVSSNILVVETGVVASYQMHSLIADVLRAQYYKIIYQTTWWKTFRRRQKRNDHADYVRLCDRMMDKITKTKGVDYGDLIQYVECVSSSIPWIKANDPVCGKMDEIVSIEGYAPIILYNYVHENKVKAETEHDPVVLFQLYYDLGSHYETGIIPENETRGVVDIFAALDQYTRAVVQYEGNKDKFVDLASVVTVYLKLMELSDYIDTDSYKKAADVYFSNRNECKLDAYYDKLINVIDSDYDKIGVDNNVTADFYYKLAKFYEDYYWHKHRNERLIRKAKDLFKAADKLWEKCEPEKGGDLDGFVRTSYGIYDPIYGFKLVKVEKGQFLMGTTSDDVVKFKDYHLNPDVSDEQPAHEVVIEEDFYIGMYPVTKGQWKKCIENGLDLLPFEVLEKDGKDSLRAVNKKIWKENMPLEIGGKKDDCPMNYISADVADDFIKKINEKGRAYILPSEEQWEYAAREGNKNSRYIFCGSNIVEDVAYCDKWNEELFVVGGKGFVGPTSVGSKCPNALGIYDMSGNVFEWCRDYYQPDWYNKGKSGVCEDDSVVQYNAELVGKEYYVDGKPIVYRVSGPARVLRGGSWGDDAQSCRVSNRARNDPAYRFNGFGLRLLLSSPKKEKEEEK